MEIMTRKTCLALSFLVLLSTVLAAGQVQHRVTRLNNPGAAFQVPPPQTIQDLQKMVDTRRSDIEFLLREKGWHGSMDDLVQAVRSGNITETNISPGAELPFLAMRRQGRPVYLDNVVWSGSKPFSAFVVQFDSGGYTTRFYVPKPCGNFWFEEKPAGKTTVEATPTIDVQEAEVCVTQPAIVRLRVDNARAGSTVQISVDGTNVLSFAATNGSIEKEIPAYPLGPHTIVASLDRASDTAALNVKPCPPICSLSVSGNPARHGDKFGVDVSGSQAAPELHGSIKSVHVQIQVDGSETDSFDLEGSNLRRDDLEAHKKGSYTIRAVATDEAGQTSTNECSASFDVVGGKSPFFVGAFIGKERFIRDEFPDGRCAALVGAKFGLLPQLGEHAEAELSIGGKLNVRDTDNSSLFADAALNATFDHAFLGGGVSFWDLTLSDTRSAALLVQFGFDLTHSGKVQFAVEGRSPFKELDNLDNNYQVWGGIRIRPGR